MEFNSRQLRDAIDRGKFSPAPPAVSDALEAGAYRARPAEERSWAPVQRKAAPVEVAPQPPSVAAPSGNSHNERRLTLAIAGGVGVAVLIGMVGWVLA